MAGFSGRFGLINLRLQWRGLPISAVNLGGAGRGCRHRQLASDRSVGFGDRRRRRRTRAFAPDLQRTREGGGPSLYCTDDTTIGQLGCEQPDELVWGLGWAVIAAGSS